MPTFHKGCAMTLRSFRKHEKCPPGKKCLLASFVFLKFVLLSVFEA